MLNKLLVGISICLLPFVAQKKFPSHLLLLTFPTDRSRSTCYLKCEECKVCTHTCKTRQVKNAKITTRGTAMSVQLWHSMRQVVNYITHEITVLKLTHTITNRPNTFLGNLIIAKMLFHMYWPRRKLISKYREDERKGNCSQKIISK